ncbi:MAG: branched-chain amino acid ABC transporter permease [Phycisphaerales bacterium]|nr:branched-chain amino acid ABC transporter permease [Phycisphaerales bacterium]
MTKFLQTLMDGISIGSLYALIALGYTMVYGILRFINFAHSDIFVLGAWLSFSVALCAGWTASGAPLLFPTWLWTVLIVVSVLGPLLYVVERTALPALRSSLGPRVPHALAGGFVVTAAVWAWVLVGLVFLARATTASASFRPLTGVVILVIAMGGCGLAGYLIERLAYKPLRAAPRLNVLITAIGISLFLQNSGQLKFLFGTQPQKMPELMENKPLAVVAGVAINRVDVIGAGTAVALMFALEWLVFHTRLGRAMQAVSYNTRVASLMGIDVDRVISFTFVLGSALAAAAGFLFVMKLPGALRQPADTGWVLLGLKAFVAAVVGGIGNIRGAMLGGLFIGLLEYFGVAYLRPELRDVYVFVLLIIVLLVRPSGLLGKATVEKV